MLTVKWVQRSAEDPPIEVERSIFTNIEKVFAFSKSQLQSKPWRVFNPPDGFIICNEDGRELRRWPLAGLADVRPPAMDV